MKKYIGNSVYNAVAIGKIRIYKRQEALVKRIVIDDKEAEKARLEKAKELSIIQLREIYEKALKEVGEANAQIFEIHVMMINDDDYNGSLMSIIDNQSVNAEYAVSVTSDYFAAIFGAMQDSYIKARAADIKDISNRIINNLLFLSNKTEEETPAEKMDKIIICADDLAPSETMLLDKKRVLGFVTAHGSFYSHTAILARNMGIPAIIGVGDDFLNELQNGETAIVDGFTGEFFVAPDSVTTDKLTEKKLGDEERKHFLQKLKGRDNVTLDGRKIGIYANIGSADDIEAALMNDAGGIGLFRSEFLYMENSGFPNEEEQFDVYKKVLKGMKGKKVIIRTLDIGSDKQEKYFGFAREDNPALGCRAIRVCLSCPEIFKTQLRALYRASIYGNLGIMFPMITCVEELTEAISICDEVKGELREKGIEYSDKVELGVMIETPAAALISDKLAPIVSFFSIGTNDLTQFTLACDRQNHNIERFYNPRHEAVFKLIKMTVENAHKYGTRVGICGEIGANTTLTETFLKMGIDVLSVSPGFVLRVRDKVRSLDLSKSV